MRNMVFQFTFQSDHHVTRQLHLLFSIVNPEIKHMQNTILLIHNRNNKRFSFAIIFIIKFNYSMATGTISVPKTRLNLGVILQKNGFHVLKTIVEVPKLLI